MDYREKITETKTIYKGKIIIKPIFFTSFSQIDCIFYKNNL
jgi:hypothetical protein